MPIAPNTPLPDFVHVGDVAKRWGVDTQYVMQFYGEAKFFIGMEPFREPYDRDTVLAQVKPR
jgi:hypothetical protein